MSDFHPLCILLDSGNKVMTITFIVETFVLNKINNNPQSLSFLFASDFQMVTEIYASLPYF